VALGRKGSPSGGRDRQGMKRRSRENHKPSSEIIPCPKVQVFHREDRENEAKRGAKVRFTITFFVSNRYGMFGTGTVILVVRFAPQNVTSVPSQKGCRLVSNGTGIAH
jgi:hypothetical protein